MENRELKFRAWDNHLKQWIAIGFHVIGEVTMFNMIDQYLAETKKEGETTLGNLNRVEIQQYTGKKDCKGTEIYDGDIIEFDAREWGDNKSNVHVVEWDDEDGSWSWGGGLTSDMEYRTVIGNIHENPELIPK